MGCRFKTSSPGRFTRALYVCHFLSSIAFNLLDLPDMRFSGASVLVIKGKHLLKISNKRK